MLFEILRASDYSGSEKPVEDAGKSKEVANTSLFGAREIEFWTKEFNTLEDILNFIEKERDSVVISRRHPYLPEEVRKSCDVKYTIEIYDDWRE